MQLSHLPHYSIQIHHYYVWYYITKWAVLEEDDLVFYVIEERVLNLSDSQWRHVELAFNHHAEVKSIALELQR